MSEKRDYYEVLGVERSAAPDEIKRAYRKLAMQHHPDRNTGDAAAESRFKEAAEAYDVLGNEQKRAQYDRFGHAAFAGGGGGGGAGFSNMEDIFSAFGDIFGGGGGGGIFGDLFGGGGRRGRTGPSRGRDLKIVLDLTLEEIDTGVERTLTIKRQRHCGTCKGSGAKDGSSKVTCTSCQGRGQVHRSQGFFTMATTCPQCRGAGQMNQNPCVDCKGSGREAAKEDVTLDVPAGVEEGMRIRVTGAGDAGDPGAPPGDLYCVVREKEHKVFQRSGPDVLAEVPVSFDQLALGEKVEIPTLRGRAEMTIPAGTDSGKVFRMRGQGLSRLNERGEGHGRGDQLVRVFVEVPSKLTDRQKELLREFGEIENEKSGSKTFFEKILNYFS